MWRIRDTCKYRGKNSTVAVMFHLSHLFLICVLVKKVIITLVDNARLPDPWEFDKCMHGCC